MQQSTENMTKVYEKANQDGKQKILLTFLGKVIAENKILVLDAFTKEGIILNPKISTEALISKIKQVIKYGDSRKSNNLKTSLSILILAKKDNLNFSNYSNFTIQPTIYNTFLQLVKVDKNGVFKLFDSLNIKINPKSSNDFIVGRIQSLFYGNINQIIHRKRTKLFRQGIRNLLIQNGLNNKSNFEEFSNLSKLFKKGAKVPKVPKSAKAKDGNMFTRLFKKGTDGTSKAGNFYRANKGSIDVIGGALLDGLTKDRSGKIIENGAIDNAILDKENGANEGKNTKGMTPIVKYSIIGAVVLVVGYVGYTMYMKGKTNKK
jgi:hypothetical protein